MLQVDTAAASLLDAAADCPFELRRRQGKAFVSAPGRDPEAVTSSRREVAKNGRGQEIQIERGSASVRDVGDPERAPNPVTNLVAGRARTEDDLDPPHERANRSDVEVRHRRTQVADKPAHEPRPVLPLQRDLLVMDDDRVHGLSTASAAQWPLITAPSMVAGRPVSIQSPARSNPGTPILVSGRGGCPGATENEALFSRTTTARSSDAERTAGSASDTSAIARSISSWLLRATTASAPLEMSDRCDAFSPKTARLSNTHCSVRPGSPTSARSITRRSNQRLTVTIGEASVRSAASRTRPSAAGRSGSRSDRACHGTAQIMAGAVSRSLRTSTWWPRIVAGLDTRTEPRRCSM